MRQRDDSAAFSGSGGGQRCRAYEQERHATQLECPGGAAAEDQAVQVRSVRVLP
jgi:hypothetical protein